MNSKAWISALRLRTLPLATASIALGIMLATPMCGYRAIIALLTWLTAISLQMLSNLANDYGDSIHGADSADRKGPSRAVQSGVISASTMKKAMNGLALFSLLAGSFLVFLGFESWLLRGIFFGLGLLSIWAAINYTAGSNPYGYRGYGDIAVLVFFGLVAVIGSYYLQCQSIDPSILLPAISSGCLAIAVLNVNNIRDIQSDRAAGKNSIPVQLGRDRAVSYHLFLLMIAVVAAVAFTFIHYSHPWQFLFLLTIPLLFKNYQAVAQINDPIALDPYLKQMALTATAFLLLLGIAYCF